MIECLAHPDAAMRDGIAYESLSRWLRGVLAAVVEQAVPVASHAYVFGEPDRLAAPVYHLMRRGMYTPVEWQARFARLPSRPGDKSQACKDETRLARRHDLVGLLASLYVLVDQTTAPQVRDLKPVVADAMASSLSTPPRPTKLDEATPYNRAEPIRSRRPKCRHRQG